MKSQKKVEQPVKVFIGCAYSDASVTPESVEMMVPISCYRNHCCCGECYPDSQDDEKDITISRFEIINIARAMKITQEELTN